MVAEIASSSASYDLGDKRDAYRRNGVREYVVWRVLEGEIDWFVLREGSYEKLTGDDDGVTRSEAFPGLWLDTAALARGDLGAVREVLEKGLATAEHGAFVERLKTSA